jgi:hypothetical protein
MERQAAFGAGQVVGQADRFTVFVLVDNMVCLIDNLGI